MLIHVNPNELDALRVVPAVAPDQVDRAISVQWDEAHNHGEFDRVKRLVAELIERAEKMP